MLHRTLNLYAALQSSIFFEVAIITQSLLIAIQRRWFKEVHNLKYFNSHKEIIFVTLPFYNALGQFTPFQKR